MHTRGLRALSIAALALVLLTACDHGSSAAAPDSAFTDLPVIRMMSHAMADMTSLESVHVKGDLTLGEAVSVDLDISAEGDCSGRMTIRSGELQVLGVDGTCAISTRLSPA